MNTPESGYLEPSVPDAHAQVEALIKPLWRRRRWLLLLVVLVLFASAGAWLAAQGRKGSLFPGPQPVLGTLTATPPNVVVKTPTTVTFTITADPLSLNPTLELQRVYANAYKSVGPMYDNGQGGDSKAGDGIFTTQVTLNEPEVGRLSFRVTGAFGGKQQNALSENASVDVWQTLKVDDIGFAVSVPSSLISVRPESGEKKVGFFATQEAITALLPPMFMIHVDSLQSGQTLEEFALRRGASRPTMQRVSIAGREYLKWREDLGDDMTTTAFTAFFSSDATITISTMSSSFASSDDFVAILSSLQF